MVRRKAYVAMDTNSLMRFAYAITTARYKNEATVKRRVVETGIIEVLVTAYVLEEARRNIPRLIRSARLEKHGWRERPEEVARRVLNELDTLQAAGVVVNVEEPYGKYARQLQAVLNRPSRQVLFRYRNALEECLRRSSCGARLEKDIPVARGFLLAYDVAAAVPLRSRAGIASPPFVAVTYDFDFLCSLHHCLRELDLQDKIILLRYDVFGRQLEKWLHGDTPSAMSLEKVCRNRCTIRP